MAWISEPTAWKTNSGYGWQGRTKGPVQWPNMPESREGETPKGDGKLFDFFLLFLSLSLSLCLGKSEMRTEY